MYKEILLKSGSRVRYLNLARAMVRCRKYDHFEFHKWVNPYQIKSINVFNKRFWISTIECNYCDKCLKLIQENIEVRGNEQSGTSCVEIFA